MLIGDDFKPFYDSTEGQGPRRQDAGRRTTGRSAAARCGAGSPTIPSSTSSITAPPIPGPGIPNQRPGDNLWTTTIFARDPDTGAAKWAYQINPHDLWDYDEINENVLLDLDIDGQTRKVLVHLGRNGYMYVIDRTTGEVLSADPYDTVNADQGHRSEDRPARSRTRRSIPISARPSANVCPAVARREGLAADRLVAAHQAALRAAPASLHELQDLGGRLHRRHALRRRDRRHVCRARRLSRRVHGLGPGRSKKKVWAIARELPGVERHAGHRRRRRLLRHDGSLVQSGRRQDRQGAVAVPRRLRDSSASPSPTRGATARNMSRSSPASAAGRARSPMPRSIRACATARSASPARRRTCRPTPRAAVSFSCSPSPSRQPCRLKLHREASNAHTQFNRFRHRDARPARLLSRGIL